jgi:hypothetical protein
MDVINNSKSIKSGDKCQNVLSQARVLDKYDVTYNVVVLGLGLASQRGGRFDKSANEKCLKPLWLQGDDSAATFSPNTSSK